MWMLPEHFQYRMHYSLDGNTTTGKHWIEFWNLFEWIELTRHHKTADILQWYTSSRNEKLVKTVTSDDKKNKTIL